MSFLVKPRQNRQQFVSLDTVRSCGRSQISSEVFCCRQQCSSNRRTTQNTCRAPACKIPDEPSSKLSMKRDSIGFDELSGRSRRAATRSFGLTVP